MYTLFLKDQLIKSTTFYMYYKEPSLIIIAYYFCQDKYQKDVEVNVTRLRHDINTIQ